MWKKLRNALILIGLAQVTAWFIGQQFAKRLTKGDDRSDEFQVAAIFGGQKFASHAQHLRSASVVASMGGIDLDLRDATLDPAGATLDVKTTMGGVQVMVPEQWAVEVDQTGIAGGVQANVTPREELPVDAPTLHVHVAARMGGVLVTTGS
jgi:predicted membrane protein